jgi:hypothetical protein
VDLAHHYRARGGVEEIVAIRGLGADRATSSGHDGPELDDSASLLSFLLVD